MNAVFDLRRNRRDSSGKYDLNQAYLIGSKLVVFRKDGDPITIATDVDLDEALELLAQAGFWEIPVSVRRYHHPFRIKRKSATGWPS